jgi:peptide/nickel transport system ATP-binding protein/oligopeptide transport system ATP-binding protein
VCREDEPPLVRYPNGHLAACHHPMNVSEAEIRGAQREASSPASASDTLPEATAGAAS